MVIRPAGVIFVNDDLVPGVQSVLAKQLHISEIIDGYTFDQRIIASPNYVNVVKQLDLRILVVRSLEELTNRALADVVLFVTHGQASVLNNKFGPPGITSAVTRLTWGKLSIWGV
ncbi:hypothetical protein LCGC14_0427330 [marine sediment metagenome]|uniref:Uncharacterized protein n=1 Tax=marine sediment metagenome TaxID=412755 RepID=A0A0F9VBC5_9ZZZZ